MFTLGRSLLFAMLLVTVLCGSALAQTITQETYDRLEMPAAKGLMYGAIDASIAFQELSKDIALVNDEDWKERWFNAGFLIGWHSDALVKMDSGGNKLLEGVKKAAQDIRDGYDAVDLGIKQKNDAYIKIGAESLVAGMKQLVTIYALIDPKGIQEIRDYQEKKLGNVSTSPEVAQEAPTPTPTKTVVVTSVAISETVGTVNKSANLRAGPGTNHAVVGGVKAGDKVEIIGKNADGSWLELDKNVWIAAFLVNQGQATEAAQPTPVPAQSPPATAGPTATPTTAPTVAPTPKVTYWGDAGVQTCGGFEWRVSNVRRSRDAWYYDRKQVAQGEYLIVYVEVKNISGGTASFWGAKPTMPGKEIAERASQYAAWMMTGGFNTLWKDDVAPGEFLTLVGAFDVAPDTHTYLFGALSCEQIVAIGSWFELERGPIKASN